MAEIFSGGFLERQTESILLYLGEEGDDDAGAPVDDGEAVNGGDDWSAGGGARGSRSLKRLGRRRAGGAGGADGEEGDAEPGPEPLGDPGGGPSWSQSLGPPLPGPPDGLPPQYDRVR